MRIGIGYDLHRLESGIPLKVGGVTVPFDRGLAGHSDGDVLLHALADSLLGAAGLPDIGQAFPDTDPETKAIDSREIVLSVVRDIERLRLSVENVDAVIHAEAPRLSPHREAIRQSIADLLGIDVSRVGLKAKTAEGLGEIGRGEAIAAQVVALLREKTS